MAGVTMDRHAERIKGPSLAAAHAIGAPIKHAIAAKL
jgi:hypothetical protein